MSCNLQICVAFCKYGCIVCRVIRTCVCGAGIEICARANYVHSVRRIHDKRGIVLMNVEIVINLSLEFTYVSAVMDVCIISAA